MFYNMGYISYCLNSGDQHRHQLTASYGKDNLALVKRLKLERRLAVHNGCVNTICWNNAGDVLLSGSDDFHLVITNPFTNKVLFDVLSGHKSNILNAKFLANNENLVISCSADGQIFVTNLYQNSLCQLHFTCHKGTAYKIVTTDQNMFYSCGEDGTIRLFDLRNKHICSLNCCEENIFIKSQRPITSFVINESLPWQMALGSADGFVKVYDRRMIFSHSVVDVGAKRNIYSLCAPFAKNRDCRITSLEFSPSGQELLVNYLTDQIYLFNLKESQVTETLVPVYKSLKVTSPNQYKKLESVKTVRLRGDWSDTGPNSKPNNQRYDSEQENRRDALMKRMSTLMTQWLENRITTQSATPQNALGEITLANFEENEHEMDNKFQLNRAQTETNFVEDNCTDMSKSFAAIRIQEAFRKYKNNRRIQETSEEFIYKPHIKQLYSGHRNARTMIKDATFWGSKYIMSGSDCGHIFIWDSDSGKLITLLEGDKHVVNCLRPNKYFPILATSGIDYDIKIWTCVGEDTCFDADKLNEITLRNEKMLEESQNTITVPISVMLKLMKSSRI